jgi:hypothetical protein
MTCDLFQPYFIAKLIWFLRRYLKVYGGGPARAVAFGTGQRLFPAFVLGPKSG